MTKQPAEPSLNQPTHATAKSHGAIRTKAAFWLATLVAGVGIGSCMTNAPGARQASSSGNTDAASGGAAFLTGAANAAGGAASASYAAGGEPIVKAVQQAAPAVVSIDTTARVNYRVFDSPSDEFWGQGGRNVTREAPSGAGSGVLLDGGYVLTNQHVVGDAVDSGGTIKISLADGRQLTAKAVGADRATDIALLRVSGDIKGGALPVAPLGATDALLPGQTVIAIGNPVGLSASVSSGVVSALGRPLRMEDRTYENLIQTDTAINPGNSGGALIDLAGRVVGINTLVRADAQNIGFAIPIKTALRIVDQLKRYGKVRRATDGVIALELTPRIARFLDLPPGTRGVAVQDLYRNSPADVAGLRQGDVIVKINNTAITDEPTYRKTLEALKIGDEITLTLLRNGVSQTARLRLAEAR